jgi:hypothetical protein
MGGFSLVGIANIGHKSCIKLLYNKLIGDIPMPKIVISGATGQLARLITGEIAQSIPATDITLATRSPEKLADEAAAGMLVVTELRSMLPIKAATR